MCSKHEIFRYEDNPHSASDNMTDLAHNEEFLKAAFKGYDLNSDGRVTVKEFRRIMIRTGEIEQRGAEI